MKIFVWTDNDLDGAGCALAIKTLLQDKITAFEVRELSDKNLPTLIQWLPTIATYDKVFFTDVYIPDNLVQQIDQPNVVIIDHHDSHVQVKSRYTQAKVIIENYTSCTKLIVDKFKKLNPQALTPPLISLFDIVNDYDSYELHLQDTLKLNAIYSHYNTPRVDKFIEGFGSGLREYTVQDLNCIKLYFNKLKEQLDTPVYKGQIKNYKVISCFANYAINEVAHFNIKKHNADIGIVVNLTTNTVSFRRSKACNAKLNVLAEKLCAGGGHEYAAGGKITDTFLNFTKSLTLC